MRTPMSGDIGGEPLGSHRAFATPDLPAFRRYLSQSYCEHKVYHRNRAQDADARHNRVALSEISLNYLTYGADVEIDIGTFDNFYMLEAPVSGTVNLQLGKKHVATRKGLAAIISPTLPVYSNWSQDCAQVMVKIARSALDQHLSSLIGRALPFELLFEPIMELDTPEAQTVMRFCSFLLEQFGGPAGASPNRLVSRDLEHAFMSTLLFNQPNNYSDLLRTRSAPVAPRHIRKALQYIESNLRNEIGFAALVEVSGVSPRALYAGFNKFVGMPPQTYIRNLRLDRAHEALEEAGTDQTVAEIAMRWQLNHLGRFSTEYRRRFGESPRDTLRR